MQAFSLFLSSPPVRDFIRATNRPVADVLTRGRFDGVHSELKFGGAAFFVLDGLRKTGLQNHVLPSFPIGNDEHGDAFLREFESSGIKTDHISRYPGRTRQNFVAEHTDDRRIYQDEFRPQLRHDHFELGMIPQCSQLLISGSLPLDIVREAIAAAKNANIPFCWNPYPVHFDLIDEIAPGAAMIQLNLEEACEVLGATSAAVSTSAEAHRFLRDLYDHTIANTVVVTCGSAGAYAMGTDGELIVVDPPVLDSNGRHTGMGDRHFGVLAITLKEHDYDFRVALKETVIALSNGDGE